eukprot:619024-Amphidinium_carterae.1
MKTPQSRSPTPRRVGWRIVRRVWPRDPSQLGEHPIGETWSRRMTAWTPQGGDSIRRVLSK